MIQRKVFASLVVLVICSYCGVDFQSLGRHQWRCKSKPKPRVENEPPPQVANVPVENNENPVNTSNINCAFCGRVCKGLRGLRMHKRTCRAMKDLGAEIDRGNQQIAEGDLSDADNGIIVTNLGALPNFKEGVKLPKSDAHWKLANDYFQANLPVNEINSESSNACIENMNNVIYDYFKLNFGSVDSANNKTLIDKYKDFSSKALKKELKKLKDSSADISEIKYVSHLLRSKISLKCAENETDVTIDHDSKCRQNLWSYAKKFIEKKNQVLPKFDVNSCKEYFSKVLKCVNPRKSFQIPDWIPRLTRPQVNFSDTPPSYENVTRLIRRMKSSGSPCPLDHIPILCFKKCPYLRSYITALIGTIWKTGKVPDAWKRAVTILIYKKGEVTDPSNFRPITLEPVPLKILTACMRESIFRFVLDNKLIDCHLQKGFIPKVSGTFEHTNQMAGIINNARLKQRQVVVTLLDLKNAFGEVNHNLIVTALEYHHVSPAMQGLVKDLYTNFFISISTDDFKTPFIRVGKGVLQGDCLSPLLFNLCFNTFIEYVKDQKFTSLGYQVSSKLSPRHWFQFADDASIVTGTEQENQILLSAFTRWCTYADMIIRVDKCTTFGIKKFHSVSRQYQPKLYVNNEKIPPVELEKSFKYLGRYFNFSMNDEMHKKEILDLINDLMEKINLLPLHPKYKLQLYRYYVLSKVSWHFTISDISTTWVKENVDNIVNSYIRLWLEVPISGCIDLYMLSKDKYGLNILEPSTRFVQCQVIMNSKIKDSTNEDVKIMYEITKKQHKDQFENFKNTKEVVKKISKDKIDHISTLQLQGRVITFIWENCSTYLNKTWPLVQSKLPKNIFNFSVRYLNDTLPTNSNLSRWGKVDCANCSKCGERETLKHVVAGCRVYLEDTRFDWRHDSVLHFLASTFSALQNTKVYADIPGYENPEWITDEQRPDMLLERTDGELRSLTVLELTAGFETNLETNAERKDRRYSELVTRLQNDFDTVRFVNLSMSCMGFFWNTSDELDNVMKEFGMTDTVRKFNFKRMCEIAIRTSYYIFCRRNMGWTSPFIMKL